MVNDWMTSNVQSAMIAGWRQHLTSSGNGQRPMGRKSLCIGGENGKDKGRKRMKREADEQKTGWALCSGRVKTRRKNCPLGRLKRGAVLLAVAVLITSMFAGCGGDGLNESPEATAPDRAETFGLSENAAAEVHFIDVGQGDSTLIIADDEAMLIDCGDNDKGSALKKYLQEQGIDELEYVIGTHPDADHIGGMDVILYNFYCDTIIMPDITSDTRTYEDVINTMRYKNYTFTRPQVGDTYALGEGSFTIIAPNRADYGSNTNDYSVGLIFHYGDTGFVFTGDAEDAEADIVRNGIDLSADVLKAGHHGSSNASSSELIAAVSPEYAVISCGAGNSYGHPHRETLARLEEADVQVYRTDLSGTVIAYTDGKEITWKECGGGTALNSEKTQSGLGTRPDTGKSDGKNEKSSAGTAAVAGVGGVGTAAGTSGDGGTPNTGNAGAENSGGASKNAGTPAPTAPDNVPQNETSGQTYILNTSTKKFHLPGCYSVKRMAEKNMEFSSESAENLEKMGYTPCKNCL